MNILFSYILLITSILTHLIAPDLFKSTETIMPTATVLPPISTPMEQYAEIIRTPFTPTVPAEPTNPSSKPFSSLEMGVTPSEIFGEAKIVDTFERGSSGFGLSAGLNDDENIRIIALNNSLTLAPKNSNGWISWRLRPPVISDGAAEMEFSITTCARGDRTGLLMRSKDYSSGNGYYFSLSCEGTISILRDSMVLDTADARSVFKNNSGDVNILSAIVQGNTLTAMLNGKSLLTVQDDAYPEGFCGFFTAPQGENTLTLDILSFKEYYRGE